MKTTIILCLCLALVCLGCATPMLYPEPKPENTGDKERQPLREETRRQSIGRPISTLGAIVGKAGTLTIMTAGISPLCWPLVVPGIAVLLVAVPIYYGGCAIAGDEAESSPFDL